MVRTRAQRKNPRQSVESANANPIGEMSNEERANRKRRRQSIRVPIATKKSNESEASEVVNSNIGVENAANTADQSSSSGIEMDSSYDHLETDGMTSETETSHEIQSNNESEATEVVNSNIGVENAANTAGYVGLKNARANCVFKASRRKDRQVLYDENAKQAFKVDKPNKKRGYVAYTCCVASCKARIYRYANGECFYSSDYPGHSHTHTAENRVSEHEFLNEMKKQSADLNHPGSLPTISSIFVAGASSSNMGHIPFQSVESSMAKARRESLPKNPKTIEEINTLFKTQSVHQNYGLAKRPIDEMAPSDVQFFRGAYKVGEFSYCVFASEDIVKIIEKNIKDMERKTLFADGTFKICPKGLFNQVLIMFADLLGHVIPFAYVFMTHKTEAAYTAVFTTINESVMNLQSFTMFMTDYERAMRNALSSVIPNATATSCWFHFVQACKRYLQKIQELKELLNQNDESGKAGKELYRRLLCLPLLHSSKIKDAFECIKKQAYGLNRKAFERFLNYYNNQWIKKEGVEQISVYGLPKRSTGAVEAHNGVLGRNIPVKGGFFKTLRALRMQDEKRFLAVETIIKSGGGEGSKKKMESQIRNDQILEATAALDNKQITVEAFLNRVCYPKYKLCANFLDFERLTDLADLDESLFIGDDANETITSPAIPKQSGVCGTCLEREANCVLVPCGHKYYCMDCYNMWERVNPEAFNNIDLDGNLIEYEETPEKTGPTTCPICRLPIQMAVKVIDT